ncbi:MAG: TonB-dependent receptor [Bacteroidota bacterium]
MKLFVRILTLILLPAFAFSQHTVNGVVVDDKSGEPLPGAHIRMEKSYKAVVSDKQGQFTIKSLSANRVHFTVTFVGYKPLEKSAFIGADTTITFRLQPRAVMEEEVIIRGTRAGSNSPTTYQNMPREEIAEVNMGQDLPYVMSMTPSAVVTSDAGAGVGYTGMRIRGTDQTRINVTINGVPYNDPESQGVFWVNLPDFASSVENIQIQRGVGTSTNGAAAFGASVNIQTQNSESDPYAQIHSGAGSFNTYRNTVEAGTGLINGKWALDTRLSKISSDGFIDRAESNLRSFFVSGGYFSESTIVKANVFSGKERTYQSWNGVPLVRLNDNVEGMQRYEDHGLYTPEETEHMINSDSRTYNYYTYEDEVDDYQQDHYQLTLSHGFADDWLLNAALHYTKGEGFFEQMKKDESFSDYGLEPAIVGNTQIDETDLVGRKWLDNDFYGTTFSLNYSNDMEFTLGGAYNEYEGDHFGEIIWAQYANHFDKDFEWYFNKGTKTDFNLYAKANYPLSDVLNAYGDFQYRRVTYDIDGNHDDLRDLTQYHEFDFLNPKAGIQAEFNNNHRAYASVAVSNREPSRGNFRDADPGEVPQSERLTDYEMGYTYKSSKARIAANLYYMDYTDQLILTGEINNVGDPIMTNVEDSYRAGIELMTGWVIVPALTWEANLTLSQNKIKDFTAYVDDWDNWGEQKEEYIGTTDIAFSPNIIGGSKIRWQPAERLEVDFLSKYVGKQYIDNTASEKRKLDPYLVNDLMISYKIKTGWVKNMELSLQVNNIFDEEYETNAWVYRYHYNNDYYKMTGYFPQAGTHIMAGLKIKM